MNVFQTRATDVAVLPSLVLLFPLELNIPIPRLSLPAALFLVFFIHDIIFSRRRMFSSRTRKLIPRPPVSRPPPPSSSSTAEQLVISLPASFLNYKLFSERDQLKVAAVISLSSICSLIREEMTRERDKGQSKEGEIMRELG